MRVMVTGSRSFTYRPEGESARWMHPIRAVFMDTLTGMHANEIITEVIHGGAAGPDTWAALWAVNNDVPDVMLHPRPRPGESYPQACFRRNIEMLDMEPDLLVACWDGASKGTKHTIDGAYDRAIPIRFVQRF